MQCSKWFIYFHFEFVLIFCIEYIQQCNQIEIAFMLRIFCIIYIYIFFHFWLLHAARLRISFKKLNCRYRLYWLHCMRPMRLVTEKKTTYRLLKQFEFDEPKKWTGWLQWRAHNANKRPRCFQLSLTNIRPNLILYDEICAPIMLIP